MLETTEAHVDAACPNCKKKHMLDYYPPNYNGIRNAFMKCGSCQASFKENHKDWHALITLLKDKFI